MVRKRRERGYSLLEVTVVLAVFGVFLYIVVMLTGEMRRQEKKYPVNFLTNPEVNSVLARLRRDVADTKLYYSEFAGVKTGTDVLWVDTITEGGASQVVMWDFRTPGEVHRRVYNSAQVQVSEWVTHGTPLFSWTPKDGPHDSNGVEVRAFDVSGTTPKLSIDEIIIPRPHP